VIRSVTKNGRSILLTAVLAVILIYLFSIVGFMFFRDDFMIEVNALDAVGINKGLYCVCVLFVVLVIIKLFLIVNFFKIKDYLIVNFS